MYSYQNNNSFTSRFDNATLNLLKSSILVSISGAFRIYLAALLLGTQVNLLTCAAGFLIIYSVYTLDRTLDSKEDLINREELTGLSKQTGLTLVIVTFLLGSIGFANEGLLVYAFLPFVTGYLYSKGIKIGKYFLRLKGGLGVKNIVVGVTWGLCTVGVAGLSNNLPAVLIVLLLFGVKTFVNSVLDDFKDVKGDCLAGIKTLPSCYGTKKTREILLGVHLLSHAVLLAALFKGVVEFEPVIIMGSLVCGLVCILGYTKEKRSNQLVTFFKDGESSLITGFLILSFCFQGVF